MKQNILSRFIAVILMVAITVTGIPITAFAVEEIDFVDEIMAELEDFAEETFEAKLDSYSHKSAGNWHIATKYDRLPWNFFHNKVQEDIVNRYDNVSKELQVKYIDAEGNMTGDWGKVDIYER